MAHLTVVYWPLVGFFGAWSFRATSAGRSSISEASIMWKTLFSMLQFRFETQLFKPRLLEVFVELSDEAVKKPPLLLLCFELFFTDAAVLVNFGIHENFGRTEAATYARSIL